MSDLEFQLEEVRAEIQDVQRRVARAEYERETAEAAKQQALQNLKDLGADSELEAHALLAQMREELATELRKVQEELVMGE